MTAGKNSKKKKLFLSIHVYMAMLAFIEHTDMTH